MSIKYLFKLIFAYINRFKVLIIFSIIIGILIFFVSRLLIPIFFKGSYPIIGITGRFRPEELPIEIQQKISNGLTSINDSKTPEPDLASSWETYDKGKTWIFNIKEGSKWQDNTEVTSKTINYDFSDVSIERPDDNQIVFKLKDSYSPFPSVVSKPTFKKGLLGTGIWSVKKIKIINSYVQELTLISNLKEKITYKFYPTQERTKLAYKLGQINEIKEIIDPNPFLNWKNTSTVSFSQTNQIITIFFNTQDSLLSEKSLRQALSYAINKENIGKRAISPISPYSWAYNPQVKRYDYDPQRAKELIDDLPKEIKNNIKLKLVSAPQLLNIAESISKDWEKLGINTVIQVSSIIPDEFQIFLTIFNLPNDPDQYPIWHSTQKNTNISKYSNPRIDKLLEDGRSELDTEERKKIYFDFQRFLLEDIPAVFLSYPTYYSIKRN